MKERDDRQQRIETMEEVERYLYKQAEVYVSGRDCDFKILRNQDLTTDSLDYVLKFETPNGGSVRQHKHYWSQQPYETMDVMLAKLTHMAVEMGLIETTPKTAMHNISMTGTDGSNAEVQLDGHTLRGLFSFNASVDASGDCKVDLGFSRTKLYLDQDFLPENMTLKIQGFDEVLDLVERLSDMHKSNFKNEDYAKAVEQEFTDLWQELADAVYTYSPIAAGAAPKVH